MLHVTNGQSALRGLEAGAIPGTYLAWDDPLHDGPVPAAPSLSALSHVRARALSDFGWGSFRALEAEFARRDGTLATFREHDETVLWFEHDLYDQLQLVQLLDWFSQQDLAGARVSLIQIGEHPELPTFHGLGELSGRQLADLLPSRTPIAAEHLDLARKAWSAVCAPEPGALVAMAGAPSDRSALPFLGAALTRLLEEYPSVANGLSRTEQQLLVSGALGARDRRAFYVQSQEFEACPWGDASIFLRMDGLASAAHPALDRSGVDEFVLNAHGRRLLAADADWVSSSGGIDRWVGGVHLAGSGVRWRWSEEKKGIVEAGG
jgi:hypothetical protein